MAEIPASMPRNELPEDQQGRVHHRPWWHPWTDFPREVEHLEIDYSIRERERQISKIVDDNGFNFTVFFVAASGFLASSYSLFAVNAIQPALSYIYPPESRLQNDPGFVIDELTLFGTVLGMIIMGHLADRSGRKRWYGAELAIVIISTLGVVQASEGYMVQTSDGTYERSMDIYSWISWWRFLLGFGIGAEYPLSAIICAEWSSTESRGTMLSAVFLTQSVGRLLAFAVCLGSIRGISHEAGLDPELSSQVDWKLVVDQVWRLTMGIGIIPAAIAILLRFTIPETPRYYASIVKDMRKAVKNAMKIYGQRKKVTEITANGNNRTTQLDSEDDHWFRDAWSYLTGPTKGWKNLVSISLLWLILDVAFYGLSLDSPKAIATLVHDPSANTKSYDLGRQDLDVVRSRSTAPDWNADYWDETNTIFDVLEENSIRAIYIVTLASLAGSVVAVLTVNYFRRKYILMTTFLMLSVLFAIAGGTLLASSDQSRPHLVTTILIAVINFVFNAGPNTLIFVLAAEIFPTVYRCTFNGIAAASGKVGAIIIRAIVWKTGNLEKPLAIRLLVWIPLMLVSAWLSYYLPDVQVPPKASSSRQATVEAQPEVEMQPRISATQQPPVGGHQRPVNSIDSARDRVSVYSSGASSSRGSIQQGTLSERFRLLKRLKNIPLEKIAPNPN